MASARQGDADPRTTHSAQRRKNAIEQSRFKAARSIRPELRFINMNLPKKSRTASIYPSMPG
jgi:hypothetical protein